MKALQYKTVTLGFATLAALGLASCSSSTDTNAEAMMTPASTETTSPASGLVGAGCAAYAEQVPSGPGSVEGMAMDPLTVAASNNPMLTTLTSALSGQLNPEVNLVETLDGGEFTVFAPTDEAFGKLDPATIATLETDADLLTSILTYHVVPGQAGPDRVAGEHETVQGAAVTVTGSGDATMVNDAGLVCGGVKTANATVYMIDTVLMPPAA